MVTLRPCPRRRFVSCTAETSRPAPGGCVTQVSKSWCSTAGVSPAQLAAVAVQEDVDLVAVADAELGGSAVASLDHHVVVFWITSASCPS